MSEPSKPKTRIQIERERHAWNQTQLATAVGVTTASISRWESRTRRPNGAALKVLASLFGISEKVLQDDLEEIG